MLAFLRMLSRLLSASTIADNNRTGWEGEGGGGGGEYNGECLLDKDRNDDKYDYNDNSMMQRMGRGHAKEWTMGGIQLQQLQCCQRAIRWGRGVEDVDCQPPHHCLGGGASCPPLSSPSHPFGCPLLTLLMSPTLVDSGGMRAFGAWLYTWWKRRRSALLSVVLICQALIQPGVNDGAR